MKNFRCRGLLGSLVFLCVFALTALVVMLLWNALLPVIIGVSTISYLQSAGILILSRLLFGGIGHWGRHGMGHFAKHHHAKRDEFFAMHHKVRDMSPDERAEFIRKRMNDFKDEGQ
ncbi:hypothetical protein LJC52_03170 [Bacteroidales bacterium OttesenSCG-928-A17]|nr:hypothetical protein [Bacteroidales bacterium OttesenSCG-928-A17]